MGREIIIDGGLLCKMLLSGFANLSYNINYLNGLNIFPVSDSDTGTNMRNTFQRGIAALNGESSFHGVLSVFVNGMLFGSRGNSGFILSQYFLGIHKYINDKDPVTTTDFSDALQHAYGLAYRSVIKPAEGTMLTTMRDSITGTLPQINDQMSIKEFFDVFVDKMFACVQETVRQMDILREHNIVDSGALGLYLIFDGMKRALHGDSQHFDCEQSALLPKRIPDVYKSVSFFRYCTELILMMREAKGEDYFTRLLAKRGDSIMVVANENILKVHIHTNEPQNIIDEFSKYGDIATKKVDDLFMTQEFEKMKLRKHEGYAIAAFAYGEGIAAVLEQLGADVAFSIPFGHYPSEENIKTLLGGFLKENLIVFANNRETCENLKKIRWFSNYPNICVVDFESVPKTFFTLSSLVFADDFKNIVKSLENLKRQQVFHASIKTAVAENHIQYSACLGNRTIIKDDFADLLNEAAGEEVLRTYSTVIVFGGKYCKPKDKDDVCAYFEKNGTIEFAYLDGWQHGCDFIIGAY